MKHHSRKDTAHTSEELAKLRQENEELKAELAYQKRLQKMKEHVENKYSPK
ncbi:hypothetical protein [Staphylococcus pettenkoferi]|uniref:hypothetical protein n=1 Tax=Staphylococcus pettenkoferi TaxID=170573 RepID=UPI000B15EA03|nr:hypothetical protein [Staphylococcus pettenkoferi]MCY1574042.1 hypothetical protein [Staphylococcus pettenkoferi]MCY1579134.1 hypothetical protein [Staphylococcus pettenkoferi]MCY1585706.1 hypothetical protein [Staphylococcus pettenkoferi]MCY1626120.1 hypothetical protein [Staphylococcus pettenkoferi]QQC36730.1 hypothetical protein I6I28_08395 [Staphylococcus pettenkoferi]